ncbi:C-type lectin domain-containing protein [Gammaproteobacteria bacterium]
MLKKAAVVSSLAALFVNPAQADSAKLVNPANGHIYQRFDTAMDWYTAKDACAGLGGHLATITSQAENNWIQSNFGNEVWLGGTDEAQEGTWKWITGEEWNYTNWTPGEPDNYCGGGPLIMNFPGAPPGAWSDYPNGYGCGYPPLTYLCEWEGNQYLDVTMIPDVSGDGVQDQAVLSSDSGKYYLRTINTITGKQLKQVTLGAVADIQAIALTFVDNRISVLITKFTGGSVLQLREKVSLAVQKTITLPK